jgi:N6-adenosine-specific RNA methylase IME4
VYDVILADPPWRYSFSKSKSRSIDEHYPSMPLAEIKSLDIPSNADCVLYLWATAPKLLEALDVLSAWGFTYKTHCVWDKCKLGMGYWFRGQHELLLVGVKGHVSPPAAALRVSSVLRHPRGRHSKKPALVTALIGDWFPDANKLELFCRYPTDGWDVWGNEVESNVVIEV